MSVRAWCLVFATALGACSSNDLSATGSGGSTSGSVASGAGGSAPACIARLSSPDAPSPFAVNISVEGQHAQLMGAITLDAASTGEVLFSGSAKVDPGDHFYVDHTDIGACGTSESCIFFGMLAPNGSLAWAHVVDDQGTTLVLRFQGSDVWMAGGSYEIGAPFPALPSNQVVDTFVARLDANGNVLSFEPFGATGGTPGVLALSPTSDGGALVLGWYVDGDQGLPPATFDVCGTTATIGGGAGFVAKIGADAKCKKIEIFGPGASSLFQTGLDAAGTIVVTGNLSGDLALGSKSISSPSGITWYFATGVTSASGVTWTSAEVGGAEPAMADQGAVVARDASTRVFAVSAPQPAPTNDHDLLLQDVGGAFSTRIPSANGMELAVGASPSGAPVDRPIVLSGSSSDGSPPAFDGAIGSATSWLALFDGAGQFCVARPARPNGSVLVQRGSVVWTEREATTSAYIRRTPISDFRN
jgi:hypothetical protein